MATKSRSLNELMKAIEKRRWDDVSEMCKAQPDLINKFDEDGKNPLIEAAMRGAPEEILLQIMEQANKKTLNIRVVGLTTLHWLAFRGYTSALARALEISNDNINAQDDAGYTPLHLLLRDSELTYEKHKETTKILLDSGAITTIKNKGGETPIDYYKNNECRNYDENKREANKAELLLLLEAQGKMIPVEILARGPAALNAFVKALKEGKVEVKQGRTIVMGLERVGKTSTINSFLKKKFNPNEPITDAIVENKTYIHNSPDDWNEAAQDKPPVTVIYEEKVAESIAKKLSKDSQETEQKEAEDVSEIQDNSQPSTSAQSIKQVPESIARRAEEKLRYTSDKITKLKTPTNEFIMEIWDFGGQPIYNVIQRIFIPSFAVVSVVFNLEHDLDQRAIVRDPSTGEYYEHRMTYLDYILYFIRSVYINCTHYSLDDILGPPILLVGTHRNSLGTTEEERKFETEKKINKIWKALEDKPYQEMVFSEIFTIENSIQFNSSAANIMTEIVTLSKKMVKRFPVKWLLVQQHIQELKKDHICEETIKISNFMEQYGIKPDDQKCLLQYLHDIGVILYYPNDKALEDTIVVNLFQVVEMSKAIITVIDPKLKTPKFRKAWKRLDSGILEEELLKHLWEKLGIKDKSFNFFVHLLERFGLLCEKKITKGQREFYVISRLKPEPITYPIPDNENQEISFYHDFNNYLPEDIYQRAVTKFIEKFQMIDYEPKLHYEHVEMNIDGKHYVSLSVDTIENRRMFKTTIIRTKILDSPDEEPEPSVCKKVLNFLNDELTKFCPSGKDVELRMYIACVCCVSPHWHIIRSLDLEDQLPCGTKAMSIRRYCKLLKDDKASTNEEHEEGPSLPKKACRTVYSTDNLNGLIFTVSQWWKENKKNINMLKVLLCEFISALGDLEEKDSPYDLLNLLIGPGVVSTSDVNVIIEVVVLCDLKGVQSEIMTHVPSFLGFDKFTIHKLSSHRRNLIEFGKRLRSNTTRTIANMCDITMTNADKWILIIELEANGVLNEARKEAFVKQLKENGMEEEAKALNTYQYLT